MKARPGKTASSAWADEVAVATGIYVVVAAVALVWWMSLGRGTTFLYDEWDFILGYHQDLGAR